MRYYDFALAPNPRRVNVFLREKGLELDTVEINLRGGGQFEAGFLARNPQAMVPCLELDDGSVLGETMAICRYLETLHPQPNLFGNDAREVGFIEMWNRRAEIEGFLPAADALRNEGERFHDRAVAGPRDYPQIPELVARGKARATAFLADLDAHLQGREYVAVERFTMADINAWVTVEFAARVRVEPLVTQTELRRWYAALAARPAFRALPPAPPPV
ncbi:MAG: glutathione S-transferase family protein [Gammaproteobacteria bacterium]